MEWLHSLSQPRCVSAITTLHQKWHCAMYRHTVFTSLYRGKMRVMVRIFSCILHVFCIILIFNFLLQMKISNPFF